MLTPDGQHFRSQWDGLGVLAPPAEFFANLGDPDVVGIRSPQVTTMIDRLQKEGLSQGPLPVRLEDGVAAVHRVLGDRP